MSRLKDEASRRRALTDRDATLLVEAAAGTGKTAILAGRVVLLLASGVEPANVAAITFTEFAAGELRERITRFLNAVLAGQIPDELKLGFGNGLLDAQREALLAARARLDELTCTTIHGFCHILLRVYSVEAGVDPGAEILDDVQGDLAFGSIFDAWLRGRLSRAEPANDAIAVVAKDNPIKSEALLRKFAEFRRDHRSAHAPKSELERAADLAFVDCVAEFRRWFASAGGTPNAVEDLEAFETLAAHFRGQFEEFPPFDRLWRLARPPRVPIMNKDRKRDRFDLKPFRKRGVWRRIGGATNGERLADEAEAHYDRCAQAFRLLLGDVATAVAEIFCAELDELLDAFTRFRRNAAVLDFDDLLYVAREVLRARREVRAAASARFARILVDEFQDTDQIQAEIIFLLASEEANAETPWHQRPLAPGRLFMVGDPKQAIYRFRGADLSVYLQARASLERQFPGNVVHLTSNFRSRPKIVRHVNECFRPTLDAQSMGYVSLEATRGNSDHGTPCVARIKVDAIPGSKVKDVRDAEAQVVAEACARMIGNVTLQMQDGTTRAISAGDIALLAPVGGELWRYERALEEAGLPFSSQAGKNLFRRQEVQDLVAVVRALADPRDRLALGALLRGPVIGLTEQQLLDIAAALPQEGDRLRGLSLNTDPTHVQHPLARQTLVVLRDLRRRVRTTSPSVLIAEAVERLNLRAVLVARGADQASRALANVDAILERARAFGVRGFREFAAELNADWSRHAGRPEGVVDAEGQSIQLVTMHSSKGLEWPVVIPINMASYARRWSQFIHRRSDDTLHWCLGDVVPPGLDGAIADQSKEEGEERLRLLYVACTRAMELLALPELPADDSAWSRTLDLRIRQLSELDLTAYPRSVVQRTTEAPNAQTAAIFAEERNRVDEAYPRIQWIRPSDGDPDLAPFEATPSISADQTPEATPIVGRGSLRGIVLHKLMEECLTDLLESSSVAIEARASELLNQLATAGKARPDARELAATTLRTLALPVVSKDRPNLVAELAVFGVADPRGERLVAGRADAVRYREGKPEIVFDWKSDVAPQPEDRAAYASQVAQYARALGASRGAVVYMTTAEIQWVAPAT